MSPTAVALNDSRWLRVGIAFIWSATGLTILHPYYREQGMRYLQPLGLPEWVMWTTCTGEMLLGLLVLFGRASTWLTLLQLAVIGTFTLILSVTQPQLWWDAFGVLGKNLPLMAMIGTAWLLEREGWTVRTRWLLRVGMAMIWFTEGLLPALLMQPPELRELLTKTGLVDDAQASLLLCVTGAAQMLSFFAVLLLRGRWLMLVVGCHALGLVAIIAMVTWYDARLWFHPLGPLTKNVSILIGTLVVLRRCRDW
jgi:hypothetical protein